MAIYWRSSNRMPSGAEIAVNLLVLPVAFLLLILLGRTVRARLIAGATVAATANEGTNAAPPAANAASDEREQSWTLHILGTALRSSLGDSTDAVVEQLRAKAVPPLDPVLTDSGGFPIRSGRIESLSETNVDETALALNEWLATRNTIGLVWSPAQLRALTLAAEVTKELSNQLRGHALLGPYLNAAPSQHGAIALAPVQFSALAPAYWSSKHRTAAQRWLADLVVNSGWPSEKLVLSPLTANHQGDVLGLIDRLCLQAYRQSLPCLALVVGFDSAIDDESVSAWQASGRLLHAESPNGLIPAEGASGVLLADTAQTAHLDRDQASTLHRVALARREKSADASGRIAGDTLQLVSQAALRNAGLRNDQIAVVCADADQRASRTAELLQAVYGDFPELDAETDCLRTASGCGAAGAATSLSTLALAHYVTVTDTVSTLCLLNQDAFERVGVVVRPYDSIASAPIAPAQPT